MGETVNGMLTSNCYAIRFGEDEIGTVVITGGLVSASGAFDNFAVVFDLGLVAYYAGTCIGGFEIYYTDYCIAVEVDSLDIPGSYHGTTNGLTRVDGGSLSDAAWDTSETVPKINFSYDSYSYSVPWAGLDTPPVEPEYTVRHKETGNLFKTLSEAITSVKSAGYTAFTLEVIANVHETDHVIIGSEDVTIVGAEGAHTFDFTTPSPPSGFKFSVEGSGSLTLGDGTTGNVLTISHQVSVTNGDITVNDGVILSNGLFMSGTTATGTINGGRFEANVAGGTALSMEKGATLSEISGGVFTAKMDGVHLTGTGTRIEKISGGSFYQTGAYEDTPLHGHGVFVQNEATIGEISGGYFDAIANTALLIIRSGWVDEISGGEFVCHRSGTMGPPETRNTAVYAIYNTEGGVYTGKTGIGTISGGHFKGTNFAVLVNTDERYAGGSGAQINKITGGLFEATTALQNDINGNIFEITGGTMVGSQGLLNVGRINKISGNVEITGTGSYGIYNFYASTQICGQIDEISGNAAITGRDYAIMNSGIITLISGGTFIGGSSAINCDGSFQGKLYTISNGVFWGRTATTIRLSSVLQLEPGLRANMGLGRYQSGNGQIFNHEDLVVYPNGYFMSEISQTEPVLGISDVGFRYLTPGETYDIVYELDGGVNHPDNRDWYSASVLPLSIKNPSKVGYSFSGWTVTYSDGQTGITIPTTVYSIPPGTTKTVTLRAHWSSNVVETEPEYTVTYKPGTHGTFNEQITDGLLYGDPTPTPPTVTGETGWTFTGWTPTPTPTVTNDAIYVAQWTQQSTPTPPPTPTPTPSPTPTLTPTVTPSPTPSPSTTTSPSPSPSATPTSPPTGTVPPGGGPTPTPSTSPSTSPSPPIGGGTEGTPAWALINLILTITGAILAIILTIYILLQHNQKQKKQQQKQEQTQKKDTKGQYIAKQQKQKDEKDTYDDDVVVERQRRRRLFWFLLSVVMGIAGVIVFILTEDMTKPMVLVDRWTIVNAIILVVEIIAIVFTFKRKGKDETVAYAVRYYLQGTKNPVISSKTSLVGSVGSSVTEYAPAVAGYTVVGDDVASLTLNEDTTKNEIIFYYTPNTKEDKNEQQKKK